MKHLLLLTLLIVTISCINDSHQYKDYEGYWGIDLSHHNKVEDWDLIEADFVILKATEGATYKDPAFTEYLREAKSHKLLVGAYHYMTTSSSATKQFANFSKTVNKDDINLKPVLDIERYSKGYRISRDELRKQVRIFVDSCKSYYGVTPIIYCGERFYRLHFNDGFEDCLYWCGDIDRTPTIYCDLHQVTIKSVPGIRGKVDYNKGFRPLTDFLIDGD